MKRPVALRTLVVAALIAAVAVGLALRSRGPRLRIGALVPLAGENAAIGAGMRNAMELAIDEANRRADWGSPRFQLVTLDEGRTTDEGRAAVVKLGEDRSIVAACANYDEEIALANNHPFFDYSLANLNPGTIDHEITDHIRRRPVWFRIIPGNKLSMRATVAHAWEDLGSRTFAVVHDGQFASVRMAWMFKEGLARRHVDVILERQVTSHEREFKDALASLVGLHPDYVLFAGQPAQAAAFAGRLRAAGSKAALQVATKYPAEAFIAAAGESAEGTLSVSEGPMPEHSPAGREFLKGYAAAGYREPAGPFGLAAYASMQALLRAVLNSNHTRPSVVGALKRGKFESALGPVRFDEWGQSLNHQVPLYQVSKGRWTPIRILEDDLVKPWAEPQPPTVTGSAP